MIVVYKYNIMYKIHVIVVPFDDIIYCCHNIANDVSCILNQFVVTDVVTVNFHAPCYCFQKKAA